VGVGGGDAPDSRRIPGQGRGWEESAAPLKRHHRNRGPTGGQNSLISVGGPPVSPTTVYFVFVLVSNHQRVSFVSTHRSTGAHGSNPTAEAPPSPLPPPPAAHISPTGPTPHPPGEGRRPRSWVRIPDLRTEMQLLGAPYWVAVAHSYEAIAPGDRPTSPGRVWCPPHEHTVVAFPNLCRSLALPEAHTGRRWLCRGGERSAFPRFFYAYFPLISKFWKRRLFPLISAYFSAYFWGSLSAFPPSPGLWYGGG